MNLPRFIIGPKYEFASVGIELAPDGQIVQLVITRAASAFRPATILRQRWTWKPRERK